MAHRDLEDHAPGPFGLPFVNNCEERYRMLSKPKMNAPAALKKIVNRRSMALLRVLQLNIP